VAVVGAVGSGGEDDAAEHRKDGEYRRETGAADTTSRRQLDSVVGRRGPGRINIRQSAAGPAQLG
jgi:hypothetical protein